jgi:hypothetical protein
MGLAKQRWMEQQDEERTEWIQEQLGDPDADEFTDGWDELAAEYDANHSSPDYDYEDDWSVLGKSRIEIFNENIEASSEILSISLSGASSKNLLVMLHAHVVTSVEAYLSSTFIEKALSAEPFMRRLVENDPEFAKRKFTITEIFTKRESLKSDLSQYLKDLIFHDIAKVKAMYLSVLDIDFGEVRWLYEAVALRHHCVHRAGYDKDGNEVNLTKESIRKLIEQCETLIQETESMIMSLPGNGDFFWKT